MVTVIDYIETFIGDFDWLVGKQKRVNRTCWAISKESKSFRQSLDNDQLGHGFVGQTVPYKFVLCRFIHVHFNAKFRTFSFAIKTWLSWVISNDPLMKPSFGFSFIISSFNDFRWEENHFKINVASFSKAFSGFSFPFECNFVHSVLSRVHFSWSAYKTSTDEVVL